MIEINEILTKAFSYGTGIFSYGLLSFIIISAGYIFVAKIVNKLIGKLFDKAKSSDSIKLTYTSRGDMSDDQLERLRRSKETSLSFMRKIVTTCIYGIVIILILIQIKPLSSLGKAALGASGIVAVIVGFAAQDSTANIVSGLFLSIFQPFIKGDLISIPAQNISGTIIDIGLRHTTLQTMFNTTIIIPNSIMNTAVIENREEDTKYLNYLTYTISYDSDLDKAMGILKTIAQNHPLIVCKDEVNVQVFGLQDSSIALRIVASTVNYADGFALKYDINYQVLKQFKENGITIPFPATTIYMANDENDNLVTE